MPPYWSDKDCSLHLGDCREVLAGLPEASVDSIVTDPPYEYAFMGRQWDSTGVAFDVATWEACLRVLKPGGHLLAFGAPRTCHRMTVAIEDAGFEIRDSLQWVYGSGFPKSLDVGKAIDKIRDWSLMERLSDEIRRARAEAGLSLADIGAAMQRATNGQYGKWYHRGGHMFFETGRSLPSRPEWGHLQSVLPIRQEFADVYIEAEREVTGTVAEWANRTNYAITSRDGLRRDIPATEEAARWHGWGTALKPGWEPIVLARKPLAGTVAANVLEYGTGALNIDGCRIGSEVRVNPAAGNKPGGAALNMSTVGMPQDAPAREVVGRWPTNLVFTHSAACVEDGLCEPDCPVAELDRQSGFTVSSDRPRQNTAEAHNRTASMGKSSGDWTTSGHADSGGASRYFPSFRYEAKAPASERPRLDDGTAHATVKPLDLMRWLVRLVTQPGGLVLDPFAGSGTTLEACLVEGFRCIGVELDEAHMKLIQARIAKDLQPVLVFDE